MPQIFDNIELKLLEGLHAVLPAATASSFCVGYLNIRGWGQLADLVEGLPGGDEARACRLLVGMHRPLEITSREAMSNASLFIKCSYLHLPRPLRSLKLLNRFAQRKIRSAKRCPA
jgi:hypothetical protein